MDATAERTTEDGHLPDCCGLRRDERGGDLREIGRSHRRAGTAVVEGLRAVQPESQDAYLSLPLFRNVVEGEFCESRMQDLGYSAPIEPRLMGSPSIHFRASLFSTTTCSVD